MSIRQPYVRPIKPSWWVKHSFYLRYMIREGSSIALAIYCLILTVGLFRLSQGEVEFQNWLMALKSPVAILFHLVALVWILFHSITWFSLAPKAANLWFRDKKIPDSWLIYSLYVVLVLVTVIVLLLTLI